VNPVPEEDGGNSDEDDDDTYSPEELMQIHLRMQMNRRQSRADMKTDSRNVHRMSFSHAM
jgi:hypothetical protein